MKSLLLICLLTLSGCAVTNPFDELNNPNSSINQGFREKAQQAYNYCSARYKVDGIPASDAAIHECMDLQP